MKRRVLGILGGIRIGIEGYSIRVGSTGKAMRRTIGAGLKGFEWQSRRVLQCSLPSTDNRLSSRYKS